MSSRERKLAVCFVCLGNICRSPTAEVILCQLARDAGLDDRIEIDSAGTSDWNSGGPPDARSAAEAARRGLQMRGIARPFLAADLERFDYVLAMDRQNLHDLRALARGGHSRARVSLLRDFDPASAPGSDVPDPYSGPGDGFARVFDLCHAACVGLLAELESRLAPR